MNQGLKNVIQVVSFVVIILIAFFIYQSGMINKFISSDDAFISTNDKTPVVICEGLQAPLPDNWNKLQRQSSDKLDENGCTVNETGCMCIRDSIQGRHIVVSVLRSRYPEEFTIDSLASTFSGKIEEFDKSNFQGNPALRVVQTSTNKNGDTVKLGTIAFTKDGELIQFELGTEVNTFSELWPDFVNKVNNVKLE